MSAHVDEISASVAAIEAHVVWLEQRGLRQITVSTRRRILLRIQREIGTPLLGASAEVLKAWRAELRVGPQATAQYISNLRMFFRWAVEEEMLAVDPARRIAAPRIPSRVPRPIPESPLELALACAPPRERAILFLAAYCGLRAQEIAYLEVADIDLGLANPHIVVSTEAAKGGKQRVVPLGDKTIDALRAMGLPSRGYLFTRLDGKSGPNKPWTISHIANDHLHGLGIAHTLHSLRHRYGTRMYAVSRDLRMVSSVMGHSNPATTAGYVAYNAQAAIDGARAI